MSNESTNLTQLSQEIYVLNEDKGFWDDAGEMDNYLIGTKLALIHSEVSEALEEWRKEAEEYDADKFSEELADVIIRTLDIAGYMFIDIDSILREKLEKNKSRQYKHGKAF